MTTENTTGPESAETAAAAAPPRRTRARRAASAPTTTVSTGAAPTVAPATEPAPDAPTAPAADTSGPDTSGEAAPAPEKKAPARRTRARRATAPTTSPEAGPQPEQAGGSEDGSQAPATSGKPAGEESATTGDAPPTKPRRSRARSGARAAASEAAASEAPAPKGDGSGTAEAGPDGRRDEKQDEQTAPASQPAARRSRSRRRADAPAAVPEDAAASVPEVSSVALEDDDPSSLSQDLDVLAELGRSRSEDQEDTDGARSATALLFQAPDTSRPRRRRAQAPAGPPNPIEGEDEPTEGDAAPAAASDDTVEPDEGAAETGGTETSGESGEDGPRRRRRRGGRGRRRSGGSGEDAEGDEGSSGEAADQTSVSQASDSEGDDERSEDTDGEGGGEESGSSRRRRRRRRGRSSDQSEENGSGGGGGGRSRSRSGKTASDEVTALKGSTRLEAKRQRRREGRDAGRRRAVLTEAEFLARRESVERSMVVREADGRVQIAVLEDGVLVEHFVSRSAQNSSQSVAGNVYLGRVQNVLPSMEAAFVDVGKGRNAVLYAGEVNWDAAGMEGQPRRIEQALKSGDSVLVQVTKDPIGHKGARLTSQITLAGRYLVYVPGGGMTGISRKLPENERARLKKLLKEIVPDAAGVIVRTAAEGASDEELRRDVQRLQDQWAAIEKKAKTASAPALLQGEPDLAIRVVRDIFNDDFSSLVVQGDDVWTTVSEYVAVMAPDLADRVSRWSGSGDVFAEHRIDEQLAKGMDRKVWLPSGGSLVIDRTEAMTVVDVNTGKFTGSGGTLEETVTRNNLEAAEEIVRQLRLRDIGGIIVIDFIDMVLESNRDLVLRRLVECLGRDRTKHQVAEVTSLGLVQMTRKRVGQGLVEAFSETCEHCHGRGFVVHAAPVEAKAGGDQGGSGDGEPKRSRRKKASSPAAAPVSVPVLPEAREAVKATLATIAAAAAHAHEHEHDNEHGAPAGEGAAGAADQRPVGDDLAEAVRSVAAVETSATEAAAAQEPTDQ